MRLRLCFFALELDYHRLRMTFNLLDGHSLDYRNTTLNSLGLTPRCHLIGRWHIGLDLIVFCLDSQTAGVMHFKIVIDFAYLEVLHAVYWVLIFVIIVAHWFYETALRVVLVFLFQEALVCGAATNTQIVWTQTVFNLDHAVVYAVVMMIYYRIRLAICWAWINAFVHRHDLNFTCLRCWTIIIILNLINKFLIMCPLP